VLGVLGFAVNTFLNRSIALESTPKILGHGGMGVRSTLPLNSLESVTQALTHSIDGVELDIQLTADNQLVAFHDSKLEDNTNCAGFISEKTYTQIADCENQTWIRKRRIALLDSILNHVPAGSTVSLDLKPSGDQKALLEQLSNSITKYDNINFLLESRSTSLLTESQQDLKTVQTFLICDGSDEAIKRAVNNSFDGVSIDLKSMESSIFEKVKANGLKLMIWGCGSPISNREAALFHPNIIQTDDIHSAVKILKRK
jgi:glycerophosphoryl diester phosphodiesterase